MLPTGEADSDFVPVYCESVVFEETGTRKGANPLGSYHVLQVQSVFTCGISFAHVCSLMASLTRWM